MGVKEENRKQYLKNREKRLAIQKAYYWANHSARKQYNAEYHSRTKASRAPLVAEYRARNVERINSKSKEWYEANREYAKTKAKNYRETNKKKTQAWSKKYRSERSASDPVFAISLRIRTNILNKIYAGGYTKKSRTHEILACGFEEFARYIESQFSDGMTWENYGEWHLDHKVPVAIASTEAEVIKLNHHLNFAPLWAKDNLVKGRTMLPEYEFLKMLLLS